MRPPKLNKINIMNFNPKVSEFLEKNPELTVIGLFWAGYWRLVGIIVVVFLVIGILDAVFE